jgi:hypothetical protein
MCFNNKKHMYHGGFWGLRLNWRNRFTPDLKDGATQYGSLRTGGLGRGDFRIQ